MVRCSPLRYRLAYFRIQYAQGDYIGFNIRNGEKLSYYPPSIRPIPNRQRSIHFHFCTRNITSLKFRMRKNMSHSFSLNTLKRLGYGRGYYGANDCSMRVCACTSGAKLLASNGSNSFVAFCLFTFFPHLNWFDRHAPNMRQRYINRRWQIASYQFPVDHPLKHTGNHEGKWSYKVIINIRLGRSYFITGLIFPLCHIGLFGHWFIWW